MHRYRGEAACIKRQTDKSLAGGDASSHAGAARRHTGSAARSSSPAGTTTAGIVPAVATNSGTQAASAGSLNDFPQLQPQNLMAGNHGSRRGRSMTHQDSHEKDLVGKKVPAASQVESVKPGTGFFCPGL